MLPMALLQCYVWSSRVGQIFTHGTGWTFHVLEKANIDFDIFDAVGDSSLLPCKKVRQLIEAEVSVDDLIWRGKSFENIKLCR